MTRFPKIVALLAFGMAVGCRDSYPTVQPPLDILHFPVGLAVRQMAPTTSTPFGSSQLVIANANFDLFYDERTGGSVLVVDPDASVDYELGGPLAVLGSARTGSFLGEVLIAEPGCPAGWPDCPSGCSTLPAGAPGDARMIVASRSGQAIYRMAMDASGALTCDDTCPFIVPIDRLDPYGLSMACSARSGVPEAFAFVSHLAASNNLGWLTRVNLLDDTDVAGLVLGSNATYTSLFNPADDLVFVSSSISINAEFRWFNPLVVPSTVDGFLVPDYSGRTFSSFLPGAVARDMALSSDGTRLYVTVQVFDLTLALQTGAFFTQGGALAVFDLTETAFAEPRMALLGLERTCLGTGQIRRLPARPGKPDLFAITCDVEGSLAIYDSDARRVVRYVGLDPDTGQPILGFSPFGLAVEPIDPARATPFNPALTYDPSPCVAGRDCHRIYVGSFIDNWINVLEMDPDQPTEVALVKRIGTGP